jgi:Zn-dependent protease
MNCEKCLKETFLPFRCQYCGGYFCSDHRLPENHACPQMELARMPKVETQPMAVQKQESYEYTVTYAPHDRTNKKMRFSNKEIGHLAIATLLVVGVGLSLVGLPTFFSDGNAIDYMVLTLSVTVFTASFFIHEMAHKIVAQRHGYWAEFRLTFLGAILTLLSTMPTPFKVISPGAVMISGVVDKRSIGEISVAGPMTNLVLSVMFFGFGFLFPEFAVVFLAGAAFNAWIALFNLIPFGIFDGFKIFLWNKKIWALTFAISLALTVISYEFIF